MGSRGARARIALNPPSPPQPASASFGAAHAGLLHSAGDSLGARATYTAAQAAFSVATAKADNATTLPDAAWGLAADAAYLDPLKPVWVPRPGDDWNASSAKAARAYRNMRLRTDNTAFNAVRPGPKAYVMPATPAELAAVVKGLTATGTRWVVRGGGHSYAANALPSGTDAVVVDVARFAGVKYDPKTGYATVGAGERLGNVYAQLAGVGRLVAVGTCPAVGSGGYLTGGGVGAATRRHGWGADNIVAAKLVLADGTLAIASSDDKAALPGQLVPPRDLLWALRGGGAGTAVVYEWTLQTYATPTTVTFCRQAWPAATSADVRAFVNQLFNVWRPASTLDGATFPLVYYIFDYDPAIAALQLYAWDTPAAAVTAAMQQGMGALPGALSAPVCREMSWTQYMFYFAIEAFRGPAAAASATLANFTLNAQLSADYVSWPGGRAAPLSPYAPFDAVPPPPSQGGPAPVEMQGVLQYQGTWTAAVADAVAAYQASPGFAYGYVLGGAAAAPAGAAARDGVGGVLDTWRQATDVFATVIGLPAPTEVSLSLAVAAAMDAEPAPAGAARRFYNFINCYDGVASTLATLYYGASAARLAAIRAAARAVGVLTPWCDV